MKKSTIVKSIVTILLIATLGMIYNVAEYREKKAEKKLFCDLLSKLASDQMLFRQAGAPEATVIRMTRNNINLPDFEKQMREIFLIEAYKQPLVNKEDIHNVADRFAIESHYKCMNHTFAHEST